MNACAITGGYIILILGLPLVFGSLSSTVEVTLQEYEEDCAQKTGVDASLIESARELRRIPDNGDLDLFAVCMLKKYNIMDKEGHVNSNSHSYKIFSDNVYLHQISDKCKSQRGQEVGEIARKIMNCFLQAKELVLALRSWRNKETIIK